MATKAKTGGRTTTRRREAPEAAASASLDAAAPVVPMRRQTIADQVCTILRREVVVGQLLPRTLLSEQDLSQRFGVSRTPIREALIKLAQDGLVEIFPQYGSFVAPIKLRDVFDSQFVREALECAAVGRAADRIDAAQCATLSEILRRQRLAMRGADGAAFFAADEAMHAEIMRIAGHANVWRQVESAKLQMDRVRHMRMRGPRRLSVVFAEHRAVVERLAAHDGAGAIEAMRHHLRGLFRSVEILVGENAAYFTEDAVETAAAAARSVAIGEVP